jgi:hypothetical protein
MDMINLTEAAGHVIANDTVTMFGESDKALLTSARLTVSVLEGFQDSGLHPRIKQKLLESMASGHNKLLDSRREFTSAHLQLLSIQKQSNLKVYDWGCWRIMGNDDRETPTAEKAEPSFESMQ